MAVALAICAATELAVRRVGERLKPMHTMMVGVRIDGENPPDFFGWDEVNDLIRHGMSVVAVVPGDFFEGDLDNNGVHSLVWFSAIVLNDCGVDPATVSHGGNSSIKENEPAGQIPW